MDRMVRRILFILLILFNSLAGRALASVSYSHVEYAGIPYGDAAAPTPPWLPRLSSVSAAWKSAELNRWGRRGALR